MDGTLRAIVSPYFPENSSSMRINSPGLVVSESSAAHHHPYILTFPPQCTPTDHDEKIVVTLWKKIHNVCDMKEYLDYARLDPQNLPNARDNGEIYCLTKLSKLKPGGTNFDRKTKEGEWVKSESPSLVEAHNGRKIVQGIKEPFYYERKDKKRIERWLMKQYTLLGKGEECELAICHIYRIKHSSSNTVSNPSDHQNQLDDIYLSEGDMQFLANFFQNYHDDHGG